MKTTITIKHRIVSGKRNLQERLRVNNINKYIGGLLWNVFNLTIQDVDFNGTDLWIINKDIPLLAQKLQQYPTVTVNQN